ncbi:hypothetical protein H072_7382 [Dactylellina haptotyla CBS 200.50]|uniref:Uncharacterized protein n=1 Tax=Dactylellina haptotyla (strain CBS 200.50) TaxID=1284197 RepID=S8A7A4_DACHA|nr:hypothetical protein H072_7382 [Dactylellina haptotyla CBS 200.50]
MQILAAIAVALSLAGHGAARALPADEEAKVMLGPAACKTMYTITSTYAATMTTYAQMAAMPLEIDCKGCDLVLTTVWEGNSADVKATITKDATFTRIPLCTKVKSSAADAEPTAAASSSSGDDAAPPAETSPADAEEA